MFSAALTTLLLATSLARFDPPAGEPGGVGLAVICDKALVCAPDPATGVQVVDRAVVLVLDGKIEAVGRQGVLEVPEGYEQLDAGDNWVMPGMIDLHNHLVQQAPRLYGDINGTVYQANTGLRIAPSIEPSNVELSRALAGGVTTVLLIPGSGSNIGGGGVLLKTAHEHYEDALIRDPGSMKVAQGDNPTRWGYGMGRSMMNWVIRTTCRRGLGYAERWRVHEEEGAPAPAVDPQFEIFRALSKRETQVSTHTQIPHLVLSTLRILGQELGLDVYLDHSTVGGYRYAELAESMGVAAIVGPRSVDVPVRGFMNWGRSSDPSFVGVAARYQAAGHTRVGFNTDAPIVPGEEFFLQAAMGARYGLEDQRLATVRGLTVVPALTAGIADRVGHLSPGTDADLLLISGHPADPRSAIQLVLIDGRRVYDVDREPRRF